MLKYIKSKLQGLEFPGSQTEGKEAVQSSKATNPGLEYEAEETLEETGTFMLDVKILKECEDLEDLLNDV